ncbi:hypothetical protein ACIODX_37050 [Streptomyces sp. NPDC088190]|uniref:hypothetical protein n=1 Tax=unclassified Streptomyces TaxID=2593676 RepID=UPI002E79A8D3|nr:hypothetical protein [Streptomyces sp. JV190]MEE1839334.1 hypothetical protein [Streptomyces sp. JV190]
MVALLHTAGFIHDQHRSSVMKVLDDVFAHGVVDGIGIRTRPNTNRLACRQGSHRANRPAIRSMAIPNASRHRAGPLL